VYAAELTKSLGKPFLRCLTRTEIPPSMNETSSREEAFRKAIIQTIEKAGIRGKQVTLALPGNESIVRYFEIPSIPRREVANAVRFEAQKYMPFEAKELSHDFEIFPDAKKKNSKVVFLAAKKDLVQNLLRIMSDAGVTVAAVEPDALSLLRVQSLQPGAKNDEVQALISAREDGSLDVVITKNKMLLMVRSGTVASLDFTSFAKEIALSFGYFSKNFKEEEIKRVFLSVDPVYDLPGWIEGLRAQFDVPVQEWNLSGLLDKATPVFPGMAVAIGAGLRSQEKPPGFFGKKLPNLSSASSLAVEVLKVALPWDEEKKILMKRALKSTVLAFGCVMLIHIFLLWQIASSKKSAGLVPTPPLAELTETKQRSYTKISFLSNLIDKRLYWTDKLNGLARAGQEGIRLTLVEASDFEDKNGESTARLKIEGNVLMAPTQGNELEAAKGFVERLRADAGFMKGLHSALLTQVRNVPANEPGGAALMSFVVECASENKAGAA